MEKIRVNFLQFILKLLGFLKPTTTTTTTLFIPNTTTTTTLPNTNTTTTTISVPNTTTTTTTKLGGKKVKKAICFSINDYPGNQNDLHGCNYDSQNWSNLLKEQYGFEINRITDSGATRFAITNAMTDLIVNSKSGDVLVFTYSGHGTSIVDKDNDEPDFKDEAICLYDGFLVDDEIRNIFNKLPQGVKLTFISDSCFSGTVTRAFLNIMNDFSFVSVPKYLPPKDDTESIWVNSFPSLRAFAYPEEGMNHVLVSGCSDAEYSFDASIDGQPTGAFSYYAIQVLKNSPVITYNEFYKKLRESLPNSRYPQTPQLEGSDSNKNSIMFE